MRGLLGLTLFGFVLLAGAQSASSRYSGCVMTDMDGNLTFCEPNHCSLLTGSGADAKLSGHTVTLEGDVKEAADGQPRKITVTKIISVGAACSQTCVLFSVHRRGIGGRDKPGSEGGTPGATSPQPQ